MQIVGYILEDGATIWSTIMRQVLRLHRKINATVIDPYGRPLFTIRCASLPCRVFF